MTHKLLVEHSRFISLRLVLPGTFATRVLNQPPQVKPKDNEKLTCTLTGLTGHTTVGHDPQFNDFMFFFNKSKNIVKKAKSLPLLRLREMYCLQMDWKLNSTPFDILKFEIKFSNLDQIISYKNSDILQFCVKSTFAINF